MSDSKKDPASKRGVIIGNIVTAAVSAAVSVLCGALAASGVVGSMLKSGKLVYAGSQTSVQSEPVQSETASQPAISVDDVPEVITGQPETGYYVQPTEAPTVPEPSAEPETAMPVKTKSDIYKVAVQSIVGISTEYSEVVRTILGKVTRYIKGNGTGFSVSDDGYIVTNYHVIENAEKITVSLYSGEEYSARVVGSVPENDVAVIKIDAYIPSVSLGDSSELSVGDDVLIIGNALGELSYSYSDGIVSYLDRKVSTTSGITLNTFQTNAAINSGNSGGPVFNSGGEVVGIASAKLSDAKIEGLGFCIPIDDVIGSITEIVLGDMNL